MSNIAIVADRETTLGFKALGADAYPFGDQKELNTIMNKLESKDYTVMIFDEDAYQHLEDELKIYDEKELPAILVIPSLKGNQDIAHRFIDNIVARAVGIQINSGKEEVQ